METIDDVTVSEQLTQRGKVIFGASGFCLSTQADSDACTGLMY